MRPIRSTLIEGNRWGAVCWTRLVQSHQWHFLTYWYASRVAKQVADQAAPPIIRPTSTRNVCPVIGDGPECFSKRIAGFTHRPFQNSDGANRRFDGVRR